MRTKRNKQTIGSSIPVINVPAWRQEQQEKKHPSVNSPMLRDDLEDFRRRDLERLAHPVQTSSLAASTGLSADALRPIEGLQVESVVDHQPNLWGITASSG